MFNWFNDYSNFYVSDDNLMFTIPANQTTANKNWRKKNYTNEIQKMQRIKTK